MIFPCGAFDGVDDPAERDAPRVVFLALGEHRAEAVFGRQDFAAEQDGLGGYGPGKSPATQTSGTRYLVGEMRTVSSGNA